MVNFGWWSLKTKVTLLTLGIFLLSIWTISFYASRVLRDDMEHVLGEAQFSTVSYVASSVNADLNDRLRALETVASGVSPAMMRNPAALQRLLEERPIFMGLFNAGAYVADAGGTPLASISRLVKRIGINQKDKDYIVAALNEGKTSIGAPIIGKLSSEPMVGMATPIRNLQGKVIGALAGITYLNGSSFLDEFLHNRYGKTGGYILISLRHNRIIAATDRKLIMASPGVQPTGSLTNRFQNGYEGYGVGVNPIGVHRLASAKNIPIAGWQVIASVPTAEVFAPIYDLEHKVRNVTLLLTLLAGALTWWMLRHQLTPLLSAANRLKVMTDQKQRFEPLPIVRSDEIGQLIASVNQLMEMIARQTQELGRAQENTFMLVKHAPLKIAMFDVHMNYMAASDGWLHRYGLGNTDLVGKNHYQLFPDLPQARKKVHQQALAGETVKNEEDLWQRADGSQLYLRWAVAPWRRPDGEIGGIIISTEDVTPHKRIEQALRASEAEFRAFFHTDAFGAAMVSMTGQFLRVNDALCTMYGYSAEELLQLGPAMLAYPQEKHQQAEYLAGYLASDGSHFKAEKKNIRKDGSVIWVQVNAALIRDDQGKALYSVGTVMDVTMRKKDTDRLQSALNEVDQANNAKSRFLAAASHDLRQPLSALSLYTSLLKNLPTPTERKAVANMQLCIDSLSELLNDLLDLSKLEAGVVTPTFSDFSITELFNSLQSVHSPEAIAKGLRLRFRPGQLNGHSDLVLLRRCIGNLIANALRYTQHGGVLVGCRTRQGKTWVEVWDSGIGIPADQTAAIFEDFKQLGDGARKQGSGLGLAIVAKTAALLGLQICVRSRPGRGSVFALELPLGQQLLAVPVSAQRVHADRPLCIALVEDNDFVREALVTVLQKVGHQVIASDTKAELLRRLETAGQPDVLVSDYRLTGGDTGFDVITAVRERLGVAVPALIITGDTDPDLLRKMSRQGILVMHKSLNLEVLQATLHDLTAALA